MRSRWFLCSLVLSLGCRDKKLEIQRAPERELPRTVPTPVESAVVETLIGHVGEEVTLAGVNDPAARPRIPWTVAHKHPSMIDVTGSHLRIVVHLDPSKATSCPGEVLFTGQVIVARGMIRQGTTEGDWAEPQLDVSRWRCR
jgi:hypothetical protein